MRALLAVILLVGAALAQAVDLPYGNGSSLNATKLSNPNLNSSSSLISNAPSFLPVEQAYRLLPAIDENGVLQLSWQIAPGYYLYKHQLRYLADSGGTSYEVSAELPAGIPQHDEFFGDTEVYYDFVDTSATVSEAPAQFVLRVRSQACADAGLCYPPRDQFFSANMDAGVIAELDEPPATSGVTPSSSASSSLPLVLVFALLGGAILNLMPCVFPVLSLKALGFASTPAQQRHRHSLAYLAGVVLSFVVVALLLLGLQSAGRAVGWGFQLQSPGFVIALAFLFTAMGLSLSGLVEFGSRFMGAGETLASKGGTGGSFFTGVLATVVASPCTGPFMGTAVGVAATQSALVSLLIFAVLGLGMALPMVILAYVPGLRSKMPKPGPWMDTLRKLLAFPLYGTAIWLLWVVGRQTHTDNLSLALAGLLCLALGLWLWRFRWLFRAPAIIALLAALWLGVMATHAPPGKDAAHGEWSEQGVQQLRAQGQAVFVDFTADWCITCVVNEKTVLERDDVQQLFKARNIAYLVADWTHYDPKIAEFLQRNGRNGIPFYLYYPENPRSAPIVLPQILSKSTILNAIESQ